jgi:hypothetical protein
LILTAALILALAVQEEPMKLACTLGYDDGSARTSRVGISLDGGRRVTFDDPENLLGDESGTVPANRRGWSAKVKGDTILLRSRVAQTGHGAQVQLSRQPSGRFEGRYYVNQGMLSERVAYGASGPISCDVVGGAQ